MYIPCQQELQTRKLAMESFSMELEVKGSFQKLLDTWLPEMEPTLIKFYLPAPIWKGEKTSHIPPYCHARMGLGVINLYIFVKTLFLTYF